ncbi:MAG: TIR domain-containing protein [Candidatus Zixiibacteriota bacterium]|nr:MAG: TIR domain-containing protein [candidate division Zixibacteria bacterium]
MSKDLIALRENVMDRAYGIVDANWPARKGAKYRSDMMKVVDELKKIAEKMRAQNYARIEQSRIYRYLGSVYSDLIPELGDEMFQKSCEAYKVAEDLLEGIDDPLERAKLNFNYGNVLRQPGSKDIEKLKDAKRRVKLAGETFSKLAPEFMPSVDEALKSIEGLLKIAPIAKKVEQNIEDAKEIEKRRKRGVPEKELLHDWEELTADISTSNLEMLPNTFKAEPVRFTVSHPKTIFSTRWYSLFVYIHTSSKQQAVWDDIEKRLVDKQTDHLRAEGESTGPIVTGTEITIVPELEGCRFNPRRILLTWEEEIHCCEFRFKTISDCLPSNTAINGSVLFYVGPILIGEVRIWSLLSSAEKEKKFQEPDISTAYPFHKVFVSYSHNDASIVDKLERAYSVLGMQYYRDINILRSGEKWTEALLTKIDEADIFQLCWSQTARLSKYVEQEWRYAHNLRREHFIRPIYWAEPMEPPPDELKDLHFAFLELKEKKRKKGAPTEELLQDWSKLKSRYGGVSRLLSEVENIVEGLQKEFKEDDRLPEISKMLSQIYLISEGGAMPKDNDEKIFDLLKKRLEKDIKSGKTKRSDQLKELLGSFGDIISSRDESVGGYMKKVEDMRGLLSNMLELTHYPSYGIPRPPDGSRAAELVELCWKIRRLLLEEANRRGKGSDESGTITDLSVRATNIDRRIYEAGDDDAKARSVELDELRPLADQVRKFTLLRNVILARPTWRAANVPVDTNSVFYSGRPAPMKLATKVCKELDLSIMKPPKAAGYANARWKQIQKAGIALFDMGAKAGSDRAAVAYELGIALTLGKPVVVLSTGEKLPFDVDIEPIDISLTKGTEDLLKTAIDDAMFSFISREKVSPLPKTLQQVLKSYPLPQEDIYMDQSLKQLRRLGDEPDPVSTDNALKALVGFLDKEPVMLIHPVWAPSYSSGEGRLFHVMPFRPGWSAKASQTARDCCKKSGVDYIRGDEVSDPDIIQSIWNEICQASHVLVDLTGFNSNVALELGISHTLGKPTFIIGAEKVVDNLFPMISKTRISPFKSGSSKKLAEAIEEFLLNISKVN